MKVLSLDSATEAATCAIIEDNKVLGEITFNYKKQHSVILMPIIDSLLRNTGTNIKDIDGFAVSKGPGSFTGLRIGMATIKSLSQGTNKPFVSISTLDGLAYNLAYTEGLICPILDALRNNVYTAIYEFNNTTLNKLEDYKAISIDELISTLKEKNTPVTFVGDGIYKFREKLAKELPNCKFSPAHLNLVKASSIAELGMSKLKENLAENLYASAPIYLRKSQAEREYDEKMERSKNE